MSEPAPAPEDFITAYAAEVARELAAIEAGDPPSITRVGADLVLRVRRRKWRAPVTGDTYAALMRAAHVPAAMALLHRRNQPLPRHLSRFATAQLAADPPPEAEALLRAALAALHAPPGEWPPLAERLRPHVDRCIARAARVELARLHALTGEYLDRCGRRRGDVVFVVCAGHQPRYRQLTRQYFEALTGERDTPGERRVIYAENRDEAEAMRLLAAWRVDRRLAARVWSDPARMQEDLLGEAAAEALAELDPAPI